MLLLTNHSNIQLKLFRPQPNVLWVEIALVTQAIYMWEGITCMGGMDWHTQLPLAN